MKHKGAIGIFDSGYGGLTVLREIQKRLPEYDFIYLGDNARTPYGSRSFDTVYQYTRQCVQWLFEQQCPLVVLACNTASAKALRNIQQIDLPVWNEDRRVLGVIRPTAEVIGKYSKTGQIGILATNGTVQSGSYVLEIKKISPEVEVFQQACPLWVPLIESDEQHTEGAAYFIRRDVERLLAKSPGIDTILLGCTHYPLLVEEITKYLPSYVRLVSQGEIVADSLASYLKRHPRMDARLEKQGLPSFYTTDSALDFERHSTAFFGKKVQTIHVDIG